jgi:predicted dehydrogenase
MNKDDSSQFNRRDFLNSSASGLAIAMASGAVLELTPQVIGQVEDAPKNDNTPPVTVGVIGCGVWGRELLKTLATIPNAPVVAVSDTYPAYLRRGLRGAPKAKGYPSHTELLSNENVQAVVVATPTHLHREVALAALEAGKHVYCEAPMAHDIDDARAIANAAQSAPKLNFQVGLQTRSDPQRHFLIQFLRTGVMGKNALAKGQWHKKTSWRRVSPNTARQKELNWRLDHKLSLGLIGEIGVHQVDALGWLMNERPVSVTGFGSIIQWNDGRNVPDTIQTVFDYPSGARAIYDCTLANSFDASYDMIYGSYAALMMRGARAWMFKEADSPLLGWEVYAKKNSFFGETGIALVANATKLTRWRLRISRRCSVTTIPRRSPSTWPRPTKTNSLTRRPRMGLSPSSSQPRPTRPSTVAHALNGTRANTVFKQSLDEKHHTVGPRVECCGHHCVRGANPG